MNTNKLKKYEMSFLTTLFSPKVLISGLLGALWCWIQPTLPFLGICVFAILLDCYTAWRCNRRIYARYRTAIKSNPKLKIDGKLKSQHMSKMISDMSVVFLCVILAHQIDVQLIPDWEIHMAQYCSAVYCIIQFVSILENESTCNGAVWARALQKIVADKTERHLGIKLKELLKDDNNQG